MTCPICGRLYCDHSPEERGQTMEDMISDMYAPHVLDETGKFKRVSQEEYERYKTLKEKRKEDNKR
jgi:hypothetical protein